MQEYGKECYKIILIKNYECNSKEQIEAEEYKVIQEHKNNLFLLYNI